MSNAYLPEELLKLGELVRLDGELVFGNNNNNNNNNNTCSMNTSNNSSYYLLVVLQVITLVTVIVLPTGSTGNYCNTIVIVAPSAASS